MCHHQQNFAKNCITLLVILTAGLGGCGHAPEKPVNARLNQAVQLNQDGLRALQRGELAQAIGQFETALRLDISIDNQDGIFADRINLARALEISGDLSMAQKQLNATLAAGSALAPAQLAQAKAALALLALRQGNLEVATRMAEDALQACAASCTDAAAILNIQARLALERGDTSAALSSAGSALQLLSNASHHAERANSLRTIGLAKILRGEAVAALESLQLALALDRELGLPNRIVDDLLQVRRAYLAIGNASQVNDSYQRALDVAEASADVMLLDHVRAQ